MQPQLSAQIKRYWQGLGFKFPGVKTAWSAVFVSWCVKTAVASAKEFVFARAHAKSCTACAPSTALPKRNAIPMRP
jgi:hypothetical protein